jgi:hypothetical protein
MDTANFLLKRESLQQRMAIRRLDASELASSRPSMGILGWALKNAGLLTRFGLSNGDSSKWMRSLLWMVAPALIGLVRRRKQSFLQRTLQTFVPNVLIQRLVSAVLPAFSKR